MKPTLLTISSLCFSACMLISCGKKSETTTNTDPTKIRTMITGNEEIAFPIHASGFLTPAKEIRLSFKTGGIISSLHADDGSRVKKGDLLASLEMAEIDAQVRQAENGYEKAMRDYNRAGNLYRDSVATLEQLQNAETALNVAKATRDAVIFNKNHSRIYAPENGVILKRVAQIHEMIAPGYPVFVFGTGGIHWKIKVSVSDRDFVRILPGDSAVVSFDAWPGKQFSATVTRLGESANPMTGTYEAELDLAPVSERLASGFMAAVQIFPLRMEKFYRIPLEAIVEATGNKGYIYIISDSLIAKRTGVKIAEIYDSWAAVDSGIQAGQVIATEGASYLSHGDKVEIVK